VLIFLFVLDLPAGKSQIKKVDFGDSHNSLS